MKAKLIEKFVSIYGEGGEIRSVSIPITTEDTFSHVH